MGNFVMGGLKIQFFAKLGPKIYFKIDYSTLKHKSKI